MLSSHKFDSKNLCNENYLFYIYFHRAYGKWELFGEKLPLFFNTLAIVFFLPRNTLQLLSFLELAICTSNDPMARKQTKNLLILSRDLTGSVLPVS